MTSGSERSTLISFALSHHKDLNLSADDLAKLTMHDILAKVKQARIPYPPPVLLPSRPPAAAAPVAGLKNEDLKQQLVTTIRKEDAAAVVAHPKHVVASSTREQALDTMENIHVRICTIRNKLHHQVELRNRMALDNDFDADDIARFDECIQRCQVSLQQDHHALCERVKAYQEFLRRRKEKDLHVFTNGLGDEILQREWLRKEQDQFERLSVLEKAAGAAPPASCLSFVPASS